MASLQTLGYICEELMPEDLTNELKNSIILALINNISADPAMIKPTSLAVKSLLSALPYANQNFKVAQERDYIMTKLFEAC